MFIIPQQDKVYLDPVHTKQKSFYKKLWCTKQYDGACIVFSYNTPIMFADFKNESVWILKFNESRVSQTTLKHINEVLMRFCVRKKNKRDVVDSMATMLGNKRYEYVMSQLLNVGDYACDYMLGAIGYLERIAYDGSIAIMRIVHSTGGYSVGHRLNCDAKHLAKVDYTG